MTTMSVSEISHNVLHSRLRTVLDHVEDAVKWAVHEVGMKESDVMDHVVKAVVAQGGTLGKVLFGPGGAMLGGVAGELVAQAEHVIKCAIHGGDCQGANLGCAPVAAHPPQVTELAAPPVVPPPEHPNE